MKHSISRKLTGRLALIMVVTLALLFTASYHVVSRIVKNETRNYSGAIAGIYGDLIDYEADGMHLAIDEGFHDYIEYFGEYICRWYRIDYTYAYSLSADEGKILLLGFSKKDGSDIGDPVPKELVCTQVAYTPGADEMKLWTGETTYCTFESTGIEHSTEAAVMIGDEYGNRVICGVGMSSTAIEDTVRKDFAIVAAVILAVFAAMIAVMYYIIRRSVFTPAKRLSESLTRFITDGKRTGTRLDESGDDEFAMIAGAFNKMSDDIDTYLADIGSLTGQREREKAELDIASRIQQGFLPPARYRTDHFDVCAMMTPAKNVGGDLYDYLPLDGGRVLLSMADVSGKGIAASMYMSVILVLARQFAKMGCSPAQILRRINDEVSANNPNLYFATVFIAIYDTADRTLTYANAGHNLPYLLRDTPQSLDGAQSTLLGIYQGEEYTEAKVTLSPGDILFLYTDGVTEAVDTGNRFFGEGRLEEALGSFRATHRDDLVQYICGKVRDFAGDAEQSDDLTMLSLTVSRSVELELMPERTEFERIKEAILGCDLDRSLQLALCAAAEEIFVNICSYAFEGRSKTNERVRFVFCHSDRIFMRFEDGGDPYDPTENVITDDEYDIEGQLGGLGKLIAFTIADEVGYEYTDGKNILTMTKYLMEANHDDNDKE